MARSSRVTVCHEEAADCCGCKSDDQLDVSETVVFTPVALLVPSTPAEMGDATALLLPFGPGCSPEGGALGAMPTRL